MTHTAWSHRESDAGGSQTAQADAAVKENFTRAGPAVQPGMHLAFSFFFSLFLFICNKCRRGGDSEEVFAQNPAQSQDHVWLPDRFVLGPGRELPAAPRPKWGPGAAAPAPAPQRAAPTWPSQEHRVPLFVADNEKLERRQKRTTKMIQGLEKMPCSRSPK